MNNMNNMNNTIDQTPYIENGYKNRDSYLNSLEDDYGVSSDTIRVFANTMGPNEDFDGLIVMLEDYIGDCV